MITDEQLGRALRRIVSHLRSPDLDGPDSQHFYEQQIVRFAERIDAGEWRSTTPIKATHVAVEPTEREGTPLGVLEMVVEWITGKPVGALGVPSLARARELASAWFEAGAHPDPDDEFEKLIDLRAWVCVRMRTYALSLRSGGYGWEPEPLAHWIACDLGLDAQGEAGEAAARVLCEGQWPASVVKPEPDASARMAELEDQRRTLARGVMALMAAYEIGDPHRWRIEGPYDWSPCDLSDHRQCWELKEDQRATTGTVSLIRVLRPMDHDGTREDGERMIAAACAGVDLAESVLASNVDATDAP